MTDYVDNTLTRAATIGSPDSETNDLLVQLRTRVEAVRSEHEYFRTWCNRADALYLADNFTDGGADLWFSDLSATQKGRSHVSVNTPAIYVDLPASMQAEPPIENMVAVENNPEARARASEEERIFTTWKTDQEFDLKFHKIATVKGLYGKTAGRIVWKDGKNGLKGKPVVEVIEQPRNLYMGFKSDEYDTLEWAAYVLRYEPNALTEAYGVDVQAYKLANGNVMPLVVTPPSMPFVGDSDTQTRGWLTFGDARIEVWDYWYRKPKFSKNGKFLRMVTCNAVFAGNVLIIGPAEHPEYEGDLPYVPIFNSFVPGVPMGRPDLWDAEQIIREKYEKITAGSQMIANAVAGDYWQLTGPDAGRVPAGLKPKRNTIVAPGAGNRIETITPFIAEFQLEQYLGRLDRELASITGINDLIMGLAPLQALSSSKAINALIANYELRLSMPRKLLYRWRRQMWELALKVWVRKDADVKLIIGPNPAYLDIENPSLSPRDDMETATRAANLVNAKLWSQRRGMDAVGVDDPETELDLIREESTDATLWPDRVQVMAQLLQVLQSMGLQPDAGAQGQAQGQVNSTQNDLRSALGTATPDNSVGMQSPDTLGQQPPIEGAPPEAGGAQPPFMAAQGGAPAQPPVMQGMLQNGKAKGRVMTSQKLLGRR